VVSGQQRILPLASFSSLTFSKKIRISVGRVTFASRELNGFYFFPIFYGNRDCKSKSSITSRKDFSMQNCSVKKQMSFLQYN
jgi:hypothetical protein